MNTTTEKFKHTCESYSPITKALYNVDPYTFSDGTLSKKEKELIALGIAVARGCPGCIKQYIDACAENGANEEQINEAIGVAVDVTGSAGVAGAKIAKEVLKEAL